MQIFDGHIHIGNHESDWRQLLGISGFFAAATASHPPECDRLTAMAQELQNLACCFGVHPWWADKDLLEEMTPYIRNANVIGEIGMDSQWCEVDMHLQQEIFITQLEIAQERNIPVVLHTKGCEMEIAGLIDSLSVPVLVHWYSCCDYLDQYLDLDCYFTLGPDIQANPVVQEIAKCAPIERIMIESDGFEGMEWGLGKHIHTRDSFLQVHHDNIRFAAKLRNLDADDLAQQLVINARRFFKISFDQL